MAAMSDYLENKLIDQIFRGQAYSFPASVYIGLLTTSPADAGGGTEVSTSLSGYGRVAVVSSLANWAGTQAAASTVASSGATGTTSNNGVITFGAPIASWGSVGWFGIYDAATAGNLLFWGALGTAKTVNNGDAAPSFAAAALSVQIDN